MIAVAPNSANAARRDRRGSPRRRLCLDAEVDIQAGLITPVIIHELSRSGFLMETTAPLALGKQVPLRLTDQGPVLARVVWSCGRHFGCEFQRPLSSGAVSAALLKARPAEESERPPLGLRLGRQNVAKANAASAFPRQLRFVFAFSVLLWAAVAALILFVR